ncbi:MAG: hypothetical protein WC329_01610 [Candidatus Omnitrophota bacterium]|jgi:hypothetical protein
MIRYRGEHSFDLIRANQYIGLGIQDSGNIWYVDSVNGSTGKSGKSWSQPKETIAQAVALAAAGDVIALKGSFNEAVTCSLAGVTFVGVGTGPVMATWTAPTVAASFCLKLSAANCRVENIKFKPVIYTTSGIPSAVHLATGSDYAIIKNCRFQGQAGSYKAIYAAANLSNIKILDNEFLYMNTATYGCAIYSASLAGAWIIKGNTFNSCLADIAIIGRMCRLEDNIHCIVGLAADGTFPGTVTVQAVDLSGTNSGDNVMTRCTLGGTYNLATYQPASGDVFMGNYASIVATTAPNGLTVLIPAA